MREILFINPILQMRQLKHRLSDLPMVTQTVRKDGTCLLGLSAKVFLGHVSE
jgi:hypothetical protein